MKGWAIRYEAGRSLVQHWGPIGDGHKMTNTCWCKPFLQVERDHTVVMHNVAPQEAREGWPFAGER